MLALLTALTLSAQAGDHWVQRTDTELETAVRGACEASKADGKPVLLGFSAPWCQDCVLLHKMESDPAVSAELSNWHRVVADVGRFDRHTALREAFKVDRIAWWVALKPTDCAAPIPSWPVARSGSFEPSSDAKISTPAGVVGWLKAARGG
jgi:thiol-disulfide isomerase/thioredoxin